MKGFQLSVLEIGEYVKFEPPFLLIDNVTEVVPGKMARGYKNFANNEIFGGYGSEGSNVSGALQFEAIGQMLNVALLTLPNMKRVSTKLSSFKVRFRSPVFPGDRLDIETEIMFWKRGICKGKGCAWVSRGG